MAGERVDRSITDDVAPHCAVAAPRARCRRGTFVWPYGQAGAGLHASVLPWFRARDLALLASDAVSDVQPSCEGIGRPIHVAIQRARRSDGPFPPLPTPPGVNLVRPRAMLIAR